jgi:acetolactate synthase-1/2/3 large subunit
LPGGEIVVEMLRLYNVTKVFGVPGDTSMALYDAMQRARWLEHVMCRDERSAGYMADAYARVSGMPGVCEVPSGGGVTYVASAAAEADGSSIPLVILSSDVPVSSDEHSALTALDQVALMRPITRWSHRVTRPEALPSMLRKAFRTATGGRTGATHLAFPENVLSAEVRPDVSGDLYGEPECRQYPAFRTRPEPRQVERAMDVLMKAARPVVVAGGGVLLSQAWEQLETLAGLLSAPVATTVNGKGSFPEISPLALGVMGTNGAVQAANAAVSQADVLLCVGTRLNASITIGKALIDPLAKVIQVDVDPTQLGNNVRVEVPILGDARLALEDLAEAARARMKASTGASRCWAAALDREPAFLPLAVPKGLMDPREVIGVLAQTLPAETILVLDAGTPTPYVMAHYRLKSAGRRVLVPRAQGSLGYALGATLGAKMARPSSTVVGLFGDGSLGMTLGEMETLSRLGLPVICVHFNNGCFGWIKALQRLYYGERYFSVDFSRGVDYVAVARDHGLDAMKAHDRESLRGAVKRGMESGRPTFIEVCTPSAAEQTPPVAQWLADETLPPEQRRRSSY